MKKTACFFIIACFLFFFTACSQKVEQQQTTLHLSVGERVGIYTGDVYRNVPHGQGTFETKNSEGITWSYEGNFQNGLFHGQGKMVFPTQTYEGTFKNGNLVNGKYFINGRLLYEGGFNPASNPYLYSGEGKLYDTKGTLLIEGKFENGRPADKQHLLSLCKQIPPAVLTQNSEEYLNQLITVNGSVKAILPQVAKNGELSLNGYVIALDNHIQTTALIYHYTSEANPVIRLDDTIVVYGQSAGLVAHTADDRNNITLPSITAFYVDLIK